MAKSFSGLPFSLGIPKLLTSDYQVFLSIDYRFDKNCSNDTIIALDECIITDKLGHTISRLIMEFKLDSEYGVKCEEKIVEYMVLQGAINQLVIGNR